MPPERRAASDFKAATRAKGFAALFYTDRLNPRGPHKVEHNLTLAERAGAQKSPPRFPLAIRPEDEEHVARELAPHNLARFFRAESRRRLAFEMLARGRYGELHRRLAEQHGWRGVVSFRSRAKKIWREEVISAAGNPAPVAIPLGLGPLMALLRRAKFVVSADTGPLHLASALGAPVIGLFGPTDPSRNGPYSGGKIWSCAIPATAKPPIAAARPYSPPMLSITVDQVLDAVDDARRDYEASLVTLS